MAKKNNPTQETPEGDTQGTPPVQPEQVLETLLATPENTPDPAPAPPTPQPPATATLAQLTVTKADVPAQGKPKRTEKLPDGTIVRHY